MRRLGDAQRVETVRLAAVTGAQQADLRRQGGRHVHDRLGAATSCCASSRPSPSLPSIAQRRAGHAEAQRSSVRVIAGEATTCSSPSCCRCSSTATAVWVRLCGSMPMVTNVASCASCMLDTASNLNSGMSKPLSSYAVCGHGRRAGYARATPSSVGKKLGACRPCPAVTQPRIVARRAVDIQTSQKLGTGSTTGHHERFAATRRRTVPGGGRHVGLAETPSLIEEGPYPEEAATTALQKHRPS